jgi:hypothetical protein
VASHRVLLAHRIPAWDWLRDGLLVISDAAEAGGVETWDDVFGGHPWGKGQQRGARTWAKRWAVYREVQKAHAAGKPIDAVLFAEVGKKLRIDSGSSGTVSSLYGAVERHVRRLEDEGVIARLPGKGAKRGPKAKTTKQRRKR